MKKYPITGASGNVYEAVISERAIMASRFLTCELFYADNSVYKSTDLRNEFTTNYVGFVKDTVRRYEEMQAAIAEKAKKQAENLRKFEEWDGDCR